MICLAAAGVMVSLGTSALTLSWKHSVEKTLWEEDWRETPTGLANTAVRVRGSGAGMEPAVDARLVDGAWTWTPAIRPMQQVILRRSGATEDWSICISGRCTPAGAYIGSADPVSMQRCGGVPE